MRIVSRDDIDRLLTFPALIGALHDAFAGPGEAPTRHHHAIGTGAGQHATHLLMPAWTAGAPGPGSHLGTKIVNVFPDNAAKGLPAVLGLYVLQSGETGAPLAVMDGTRLTHWRTAAASGLAARALARPDARRLLMVGAVALAPFLIRAHRSARPIDHVTVWNRRTGGAEALAASLGQAGPEPEIEIEVAQDLETAVGKADIVSCATLSTAPLIQGAWLRPGQHIDLVGAFNMQMREADDVALRRARVYVDTPTALTEGGDVAIGIASGALTRADIVGDLHGLCCGSTHGRQNPDEITMFKSVGSSIEDLAAAMLVWSLLRSGDPG